MSNQTDIKLIDLLPDNLAQDGQVQSMAGGIQPELDKTALGITELELYCRIDELPEPMLKMLAVEHRVFKTEWELATTIEDRRELIKNSFELNLKRGTRWSVERILGILNINANLSEWFEYGGEPYHFSANIYDINGEALTSEQLEQASRLINEYKPLRARFEGIDVTAEPSNAIAYTGAVNSMVAVVDCLP